VRINWESDFLWELLAMELSLFKLWISVTVLLCQVQMNGAHSSSPEDAQTTLLEQLTHGDLSQHRSPGVADLETSTAAFRVRQVARRPPSEITSKGAHTAAGFHPPGRKQESAGFRGDSRIEATKFVAAETKAAMAEALLLGALAAMAVQAFLRIFAGCLRAPTALTMLEDRKQVTTYAACLANANGTMRAFIAVLSIAAALIEIDWDTNGKSLRLLVTYPSLRDPLVPFPDFPRWVSAVQCVYLSFGAAVSLYLQSFPKGVKDRDFTDLWTHPLALHSILCSITRVLASLILLAPVVGAVLLPSASYGKLYARSGAAILNLMDIALLGSLPLHIADALWPLSFVWAYHTSYVAYYGLLQTQNDRGAFRALLPWVNESTIAERDAFLLVAILVALLHLVNCMVANVLRWRGSGHFPSVSCVCFLRTRFEGVSQSMSFSYPLGKHAPGGGAGTPSTHAASYWPWTAQTTCPRPTMAAASLTRM
jgi:hypothetical protein